MSSPSSPFLSLHWGWGFVINEHSVCDPMKTAFCLLALTLSTVHLAPGTYGGEGQPRQGPREGMDSIRRWNKFAIDAAGVDHTPAAPGENRAFYEQLGPGRSSRAMAIVHIAMFDTVNALVGEYQSYTGVQAPSAPHSMQAAISQAAHDTLVALYPAQTASIDARLAEELGQVPNHIAKANGIDLGKRAA